MNLKLVERQTMQWTWNS